MLFGMIMACCVALSCGVLLPRGGGNLAIYDAEPTVTERNQLAIDLANQAVSDVESQLDEQALIYQEDVASRVSLSEAYSADFATWCTEGGVAPLNSDSDISGQGLQNDPYLIKTLRGWVWFVCKSTYIFESQSYVYAKLAADLDFDGYVYDFITTNFRGFYGSLDGDGFALKNLAISCPGLFMGLGSLLDLQTMELALYEQRTTEILNLNVEIIICEYTGTHDTDIPPFVFGMTAYNTNFANVEVKTFALGEFNAVAGYTFGGINVQNCNFDMSAGGSSSQSVLTSTFMYALSGEGVSAVMGLNVTPLKDFTNFENCTVNVSSISKSSIGDAAFGCLVGFLCGGSADFTNCTTQGLHYAFGGVGGAGFIGDVIDSQVKIANCKNFATIVSSRNLSGFVGRFQAGQLSTVGSLLVQNCKNYGDLYCIGSSDENMAAGGIVGRVDQENGSESLVTVSNCKNFGSIYSGNCQGGIIGRLAGSATISDCENYGDLKFVLVEINQAGILEMAAFGAAAGIVTSPFWSSPTTFVLNIENCNNFGNIETNPRTYDYVYETSSGQYRHSEGTVAAGIYAGTSSYFGHGTGTGTNPSSIDVVNITDSNNFGDISTSCNFVAGIMFEYGYQCTARLLENCGSFGDIFVISSNSYVSPLVLTQLLALGNVIISNCYVEASAILQEQQDSDGQIVSSESSLVGALLLNPLDGIRNLELSNVQISFSINLENLTALSADAYVLNNSVGDSTPIDFGYIEGQTVASVSNVLVDLNYIFPDYFQPEEKNYSREWTDITIGQSILIDVEFCKNQTREDVCKNYVHTNDQTQPFSTSDWFFDEKLNNGMPMLRSFYFLANNLTDQQDVFARLLELGFTPQA